MFQSHHLLSLSVGSVCRHSPSGVAEQAKAVGQSSCRCLFLVPAGYARQLNDEALFVVELPV